MELLQAGVDLSVIALWLGHESILTTQAYLHAHIALKTAALAKLQPHNLKRSAVFEPEDRLLAFLDSLSPAPAERSAVGLLPEPIAPFARPPLDRVAQHGNRCTANQET